MIRGAVIMLCLISATCYAISVGSPQWAALWVGENKSASSAAFEPPVTNGLVAWYRFEGGSLDSSYNGSQTLTNFVAGTVVQIGAGVSGDGLIFNTSNRFALATAFMDQTNYPYSIMAWAAVTGAYATLDFVCGINGDSSSEYIAPIIFSSGWGAIHRATTQRNILPGAGYPTQNQWYHLAVVAVSDSNASLYVNGVRIGTSSSSAGTGLTTPQVGIASFVVGAGNLIAGSWAGWVDEVGFYTSALTSNQVKAAYDAIP